MAEAVVAKIPKWSYPAPVSSGLEITRLLSKNKELYISDSFSPKTCDIAHKELSDTLKSIDRNKNVAHFMIAKAATKYLDTLEMLKEFLSKKCQSGITFSFVKTLEMTETFSWNSSKSLRPIETQRDRAMIKKKIMTNSGITPSIIEAIPVRDEFVFSIEYEACFALCCIILAYMNLAEIKFQESTTKTVAVYNMTMGFYRRALILCQSAVGWAQKFQELNHSEQIETKPTTFTGLCAYCYGKMQLLMTEREAKRIDTATKINQYLFVSDQMTIAHQCINTTWNACCAPGIALFALYYRFLYIAIAHCEYAKLVADGLYVQVTKNGVTTTEKQMQDAIDYGKAHNVVLAGLFFLDLADNVAERCGVSRFKEIIVPLKEEMASLQEQYFKCKDSMGKAFFKKYVYATPSQIGASPFLFVSSLGSPKETISEAVANGKQDLFITEQDLKAYL